MWWCAVADHFIKNATNYKVRHILRSRALKVFLNRGTIIDSEILLGGIQCDPTDVSQA